MFYDSEEVRIFDRVFYACSSFADFISSDEIFHSGPTINSACISNSPDAGKALHIYSYTFVRLIFGQTAQTFHMRGMFTGELCGNLFLGD